jgi:predicted kinase
MACGVWLEAPLDTLVDRVAGRRADASDADAAVVRRQTTEETGTISWRRLDARAAPATLAQDLRALLRDIPADTGDATGIAQPSNDSSDGEGLD